MNNYDNYETYEIEDFLCDDHFIQWVLDPQKEDNEFWSEWMLRYPHRSSFVLKSKDLISKIHIQPLQDELSDSEVLTMVDYVHQHRTDLVSGKVISLKIVRSIWFRAAAVIMVFFMTGLLYHRLTSVKTTENSRNTASNKLIKYFNNTPESRLIRMNDGSLAVLKPNSSISYPAKFAGLTREIFLDGEAFFEVHKNHKMPFLVHSQNMVVKVLGTSFNVKAYAKDKVFNVVVNTGKVQVYTQGINSVGNVKTVILFPNQQTAFKRVKMEFKKDTLKTPLILSSEVAAKEFTFSNTPVSEIIEKLDNAYHVHIIYDQEKKGNLILNASLSNLPLDEKVKLICRAINAQCDFTDGRIEIY